MARQVKCQQCGDKADQTTMIKVEKGKRNLYFHTHCHEEFLKREAFIEQELKERDELNDAIKRIHNLEIVPSSFWSQYLQMLRNGTLVASGKKLKKYKQGVKYSTMTRAYKIAEVDILQSKVRISFDSEMQELIYGFRIMSDKINFAGKKESMQAPVKSTTSASDEIEKSSMKREIRYEKREDKDDNDISDFLD